MSVAFVEQEGARWRVTMLTIDGDDQICTTLTVSACQTAMIMAEAFARSAAEGYSRRTLN